MTAPRSKRLIKLAVALGALAVLGFLFMRSVRGTRSTPYTVEAAHLRNWTLTVEPASGAADPLLVLQAPQDLIEGLYHQIFRRAMESLSSPTVPGIPLLLKGEFDRAFAGQITPEALLGAARKAGLDSIPLVPRCLGYRRVSDPTGTEQLYFVLFDLPAFGQFREQIGGLLDGAAAPRAGFDPAALSPVLFIALSGSLVHRWLPLRANPETDCVAPIAIGSPS